MRVLLICVGIPGSGKTTAMRRALEENPGMAIVSPDAIRKAHGVTFDRSIEPQVWEEARRMVSQCFHAGHQTVAVDATNVTESRRREWVVDLTDPDCPKGLEHVPEYAVQYAVFPTPFGICQERRKGFPQEVLKGMAERFDAPSPILLPNLYWHPTQMRGFTTDVNELPEESQRILAEGYG